MTGTVPDLIRSVVARTKLPRAFVEQSARELQNAGILPIASGRAVPTATPRDLARLLLALGADRVRKAPATAMRLGECHWPFRTENAASAIEAWVAEIFDGDRE